MSQRCSERPDVTRWPRRKAGLNALFYANLLEKFTHFVEELRPGRQSVPEPDLGLKSVGKNIT